MTSANILLSDRIVGGLLGLLIGDAVGVPYEFHKAGNLPPADEIDMIPPPGFPRSHSDILPGTWSDDGAQALCLLASLLACQGLDLHDFSRRLLEWADRGYCAVDGIVFDIGLQTSRALNALRSGSPAQSSGPADERENGNGSLMRVLPLALWHRGDDEELIWLGARQSLPTHGHSRSRIACAMYCLWARYELEGIEDSWQTASTSLRKLGPIGGLDKREIELVLTPPAQTHGSGYVVDSLWSARIAVDESIDYAATIRRAISFGNDTDTTAAIAGGIAGIRHGASAIPPIWQKGLRGRELLDPLLRALINAR
ncbi:MAG: ADP-ribosylglycohydrolase family protein [Xanthomonadales bacterium]|uniref:ADP-ribosylglycohydrolase family protein n=1 Tax=Dokdonella sp. TaxID=2291710 RepID=UPI002BDC4FFA|nr:ADP-ribosylglycohydrolase family protein [Xanthomonadales bacterium]MBK7211105.1 ADP-ribosylglycohydrolase family protein [Xanthomonadales bacterium]HQW75678.1 ADP-ribosylglycohydrolase family protein [Dokdonella sp.]HQY53876.1 ADP-ribosylglycohydrolase family protein [Dokdonella sp.]HQZ60866.1 ADP-ribosylglycohydrolase family protein [Dokdonella sp.]